MTEQGKKPRVLMELRPAFDGYAGIPQETRLLFRGLRMLSTIEVSGMLQMSHRILARGTREGRLTEAATPATPATRANQSFCND